MTVRRRPRPAQPGPGPEPGELDRAAAAAVAQYRRRAELAERVHAGDRDRERQAAAAQGGPCCYCGSLRSSPRPAGRNGPLLPSWHTAPAGVVCAACDDDRRDPLSGTIDGDQAHRWRVLLRLLPELRHGWLAEYAVPRSRFAWWHETPGAQPGGDRFAYCTREALRENLRPPAPAPLATREPCPRCGVAARWRRSEHVVGQQVWDRDGPVPAGTPPPRIEVSWACVACQAWPEDLDECAAKAAGVKPYGAHLPGLASRLGLAWWAEAPARARRRPARAAFAHWPPRSVLKARAARLLGGDVNAWPHDLAKREAAEALEAHPEDLEAWA